MKSKIRLLIREEIESFLTHDNGGRAFCVSKDDEHLFVFKQVLQTYDNVLKVFSGDKEDKGSSVLIELAARDDKKESDLYYKKHKHKYLFIGTEIYTFETDEPIIKFYSKIGNSDVPYPVALSEENVYFMLDYVFVNKNLFPKDTDWKDAYTFFYDNKELKKIKFYDLKKIDKSPLTEQFAKLIIRKRIKNIIKEVITQKKLGQFSLDSGQAVIVDPAHLDNYKKELDKMSKGDFKANENNVKSLGKHKTGLYLSLFGGDGTFDVYGVYSSKGEWPHLPYKLVIHTRNSKDFPKNMSLFEGTGDFYPGYSDDGTSDTLAGIREKTSPIVNKELKKLENKLVHYKNDDTKERDKFWSNWMYANLITTCLQDGFYIKPELVEKAIECYKKCLNHPNIKEITEESYKSFVKQVGETLKQLETDAPIEAMGKRPDCYYIPGFMDRRKKLPPY